MDRRLSSETIAQLVKQRIGAVRRIGSTSQHQRRSRRQQHLNKVVEEASVAIATRDLTALRSALLSVELLSFELCEDD